MKYRHIIFWSLSALIAFFSAQAEWHEAIGRSFMFTRPAYYNLAMYWQAAHAILLKKEGHIGGGVHGIGFYLQSQSQNQTARYFLINCKTKLLVSGDTNVGDTYTRDVRANWLNLPDNFRGYLSIKPKQKQAGFLIEYNQNLCTVCPDITFLNNSWIGIIMPVVFVENDINICQSDVVNQGNPAQGPANILQAFRQRAWCSGKMVGKRRRIAPAEIRVNLGQTYHSENYFEFAYYSSLVIPTGNKPKPETIFEPVVGNGKHVGIGGGVTLEWVLNRDPVTLGWCMFVNLEGIFLIRNHQWRTFDLKDKPWSRYLLYNMKNGPPNQNIPGVNILTRKAVVRPYGMFDFSVGFRLRTEHMELEFGYNVWGHDHERVHLCTSFVNECSPLFGIAGVGALNPLLPADQQVATSASQSTIGLLAPNDLDINGSPIFIAIRDEDIDLKSAAAASALNQKVHIAAAYIQQGHAVDYVFGGGYYIEFPHKNGALRTWGAWLKGAVTF